MDRRWSLIAGLAGVAVVVAIAIVLARRDTTTVMDAAAARSAAVTSTEAPRPTAAAMGDDGEAIVYVYDTIGYEEIDALAGARHDYPAETFVTVSAAGCGEVLRWQAIEERWVSWEVCDRERLEVIRVESFHRWFGVDDAQQYDCSPPATYLPPSSGGDTWTFTCTAAERTETTLAEVVGKETLRIGARDVAAVHVRFTSTLSGESTGGTVVDRWFGADGLLLKEVSSTTSASKSAIGTVNYTEEYQITLRSLEPSAR